MTPNPLRVLVGESLSSERLIEPAITDGQPVEVAERQPKTITIRVA
jgi:hypothetical protein